MPVYDYECHVCGPFQDLIPMAQCLDPQPCPSCAEASPRMMLTAPRVSGMSAERLRAHATNERSAHAPKTLNEMKSSHGAGCSCCSTGKKGRELKTDKAGTKSFPTARPWMISH